MIKTGIIQKSEADDIIDSLYDEGYHMHHVGGRRGYVSRKTAGTLEPYSGRFGTGYIWEWPRYNTTQYTSLQYWIK